MRDEETEAKVHRLIDLFIKPINSFIETFILGKSSKSLRVAGTYFIKALWESAKTEYKTKIFDLLIAKIPYLHSYGIKAIEFFDLITYILKQSDKKEINIVESRTDFESKINNVFQYLIQSLNKANNLIFSHQNLELYSSNIYGLISNKKTSTSTFGDYGESRFSSNLSSSQSNTFIFEREP